MTGIVVAIGNLIPELTTTILSFMRHGVKMTEFGVACNLGSACFTITVVPAVAFLLTQGKSKPVEKQQTLSEKKEETSYCLATFIRDISFFVASLILYDIFLLNGVIHLSEAVFISGFLVIYIFIIIQMNRANEVNQKTKRKLEKLNKSPQHEENKALLELDENHYLPND